MAMPHRSEDLQTFIFNVIAVTVPFLTAAIKTKKKEKQEHIFGSLAERQCCSVLIKLSRMEHHSEW